MSQIIIVRDGKGADEDPLMLKGLTALEGIKRLMKKIDPIVKEARQNQHVALKYDISAEVCSGINGLFEEMSPELMLHLRLGQPLRSIAEYIGKIAIIGSNFKS